MSKHSRKIFNGVLGTMLAISFVVMAVVPTTASAVTVEELQAQIAQLMAQLQTMSGQTSVSSYNFTRNLTVGSTGSDVMNLQKVLNGSSDTQVSVVGAGSPGNETSYFGPATRAAVVKFQTKYGIAPAVGYVGPVTRAKLNSMGGTTPTVPTTPGTTPTVGTGLTVSDPGQPAVSLAPDNAARVPFTKVRLSAGTDGDVTVTGVVVQRTGLAQDANFAGVVLLDETGAQVGLAKTFNSDHKLVLNEPFVVKAGTSKVVTIAGNMDDDNSTRAGEVASLTVVQVNTNGASVSGTLPITGAGHTINATLSIGSVTMQRGGADPASSQTKEVGVTGYTFSAVRVTAGSAEDITLRSIRWNQTGSVGSGDIANVKTYVDGVAYNTVVSSDGKYYTSVFGNGISIAKGFNKEISIKGDIIGGSGRTVDFDIAKRTDVDVVGQMYGYGIIPPQTGSSVPTADTADFSSSEDPWYDAAQVTVSSGSVTVSADTAISAQNIAVNALNQPFGGWSVDVRGEAITVAQMVFNVLTVGNEVSDITNAVLVDGNGSVLAGPVDGVDTTDPNGTLTFTNTVTFQPGITKIMIKGKLGTDFVSNDTVQASTTPSTQWTTVKGLTTGNSITPSPASAITSSSMTVKAGALAVSISSQPSARSVIAGSQGFEFARYVLDATQSGEDVRLSSIPLQLTAPAAASRAHLTNCALWNGSTAVITGSNVKNPSTSLSAADEETFTFDGAGFIVPKNSSVTLSLKCNVSTSASGDYSWGLGSTDTGSFTGAQGVESGQTIGETWSTGAGQTMTAASYGSYSVAVDSSTTYAYRAVRAGTAGVPIAAFKFTAGITEDVNLQKVALQLGNIASNSPADLVNTQVTLWNGSTQVGTAQFGGANADNATSTALNVRIPKGETVTVVVKGDLSVQNASEGTPGAFLAVTYDGDANGLANGNYGIGVESGSNISPSTSDITTNGVRIFRNVPTLAVVSSSNSNLAPSSDFYKFSVTNPDPTRDLVLKKFVFSVATTGGAVSSFKLYDNAGNAAASAAANASGDTGSQTVTITFDVTAAAKIVPAGSTKTYGLRASTIEDGSSVAETITVYLKTDSSYAAAGTSLMNTVSGLSASNMIWSPFSTTTPEATSATESNLDWYNGYGVPGFPGAGTDMDAQTFTRPA